MMGTPSRAEIVREDMEFRRARRRCVSAAIFAALVSACAGGSSSSGGGGAPPDGGVTGQDAGPTPHVVTEIAGRIEGYTTAQGTRVYLVIGIPAGDGGVIRADQAAPVMADGTFTLSLQAPLASAAWPAVDGAGCIEGAGCGYSVNPSTALAVRPGWSLGDESGPRMEGGGVVRNLVWHTTPGPCGETLENRLTYWPSATTLTGRSSPEPSGLEYSLDMPAGWSVTHRRLASCANPFEWIMVGGAAAMSQFTLR